MFDQFSLARKYIRKALLKPVAFTLASYYILKRKLSINVSLKKCRGITSMKGSSTSDYRLHTMFVSSRFYCEHDHDYANYFQLSFDVDYLYRECYWSYFLIYLCPRDKVPTAFLGDLAKTTCRESWFSHQLGWFASFFIYTTKGKWLRHLVRFSAVQLKQVSKRLWHHYP